MLTSCLCAATPDVFMARLMFYAVDAIRCYLMHAVAALVATPTSRYAATVDAFQRRGAHA